jgi:hypothetical protein
MKKIVICVALALCIALSAVSFASADTYTATSTSTVPLKTVTSTHTYFGVLPGNEGYIHTKGSATKLTLRAYTTSDVRNSNAVTYKSGSLAGVRDYWDITPTTMIIKGNIDASGKVVFNGGFDY